MDAVHLIFAPIKARPQTRSAVEEPEPASDVAVCSFCGVELPYRGLCPEYRESIQENQREIELDRQQEEADDLRSQRLLRWGCLFVILLIIITFALKWLGAVG